MSEEPNDSATGRLVDITLDERTVVRRSADVEHERAVAIFDLLEENRFELAGEHTGPFSLHLSVRDDRLLFDVRDPEEQPLEVVPLALAPFRRIVKDYFTVCESYFESIKTASPSRRPSDSSVSMVDFIASKAVVRRQERPTNNGLCA